MIEKKCLVCESSKFKKFIKTEYYNFLECSNCKLIFTEKLPTDKELEKFYNQDYYIFDESKVQENRSIFHLNILKNLKIPRGKLLDIGCANGDFIKLMKNKKFDVNGIDISKDNISSLKKNNPELNVYAETIDKHKNKDYDLITMWDVLEHLNDPNKDIKEIYKRLNFGGILLIETPNINSLNFKLNNKNWIGFNPFHIIFFREKTIKYLFKKIGFKELKFYYTNSNKKIILASLLRYRKFEKILKNNFLGKILSNIKERSKTNNYDPKTKEVIFKKKNGDSMIIYAKK